MDQSDKTLFQYCQKIVLFTKDLKQVLLARRKGEADFDEVYSFVGGKMETNDGGFVGGIRRELIEELGDKIVIKIAPDVSVNEYYVKNNGLSMVLPHHVALFEGGEIKLNDEYSDYKWVNISELHKFEPKISTVEPVVHKLLGIASSYPDLEYIDISPSH